MRQAPETIDSVTTAFHLSDSERKYLLSAGKGQALISAYGVRVPVQIVASELEYTFAVSNPVEVQAVAAAQRVTAESAALVFDDEDDDTVLVSLDEVATMPLSFEKRRATGRTFLEGGSEYGA